MSGSRVNPRFSLVGTLLLSVFSLGALALPLSQARAQCLGVDLGFGCAGLGVGSWYTQPYYYGYPTYYGYPYYGNPAYSYPSYRYPYYSYYYGYQ